MSQSDLIRLDTSLEDLRRRLAKLDGEIAVLLDPLLRRRRYWVEVVWTAKTEAGVPLLDPELEAQIDAERLDGGMTVEMVAVLRAIREATRPPQGKEL